MKPFANRFLPQTFVLCLVSLASQSHAGEATFSSGALLSDANSGVSTSKTYTALGNVVGSNVTVNSATFVAGGTSGTGWSLTGLGTNFASGGNKTTNFTTSTIDDLFAGFQYGGNPGTITMSGLTAGQTYVTTLYCQGWGWPAAATRQLTVTGSEGGSIFFNEDAIEASMLRYTFVATAATMTLNPLPYVPGSTLHLYGLSNEQVFNKSWTSGSDWTTAVWSTAGTPNSVGANANFAAPGAPATINLDASQTVGHVKFDGANGWTLSSSNSSVFTLQTDAGGVSVISTATGSHVISTAVALGSDVMKSGAGTLTLSGAVSGSGKGITVTGGLLKFGQTNSYTGATTVNAGTTLDLNDTVQTLSALNGAGTVLSNGSTAQILTVGSGAFSGLITDHTSGTGTLALTKSTSGTLTFTKPQTYTGATVVNDGVLRLEGSGSPLLTDNFSATGTPDTNNLNYNIANRQTGSLATQTWTKSVTAGTNMQVGNGGTNVSQPVGTNADYLLLASTNAATQNASLAATALSAANVTGPLKISFDMFRGNNVGNGSFVQTDWTSFALRGTANNAQPNTVGAGEIGFLYRRNSGLQVFSGGVTLLDLTTTTGGDSFAFYLTDLNGTGSPFGGAGARLVVTQGGVVIGRYTLSAALSASRYISFGNANAVVGGVDNLAITVMPSNLLPAANTLNLTAATSAVQLDNVNQTIAKLDGVSGSSISITGNSILTVNGTAGSTFAGSISGTFGNLTKSGSDTLTLTGTASTYGGYTVLNGGVLNVASFANYGVNSSIGNRAADSGTGNVGLLFRGGTLQYTGSTAQSTNRAIRISTTGGAIIDASGSDPSATLSFTAASSPDFFENGGDRGLVLTGSNTGLNTFSMPIIQTGGLTSLTKSGAGTWMLNATNTYTGTTTINGGILSLGSAGAISTAGNIVFGGGTLKYGTTTTDYSARIESGTSTGAVSIDTNGLNVTFATGFSTTKSGGLTKTGAGKLTLSALNRYTGPTTLSNGTLRISTGAITDSTIISGLGVAAGTSLEVLAAADGLSLTTDSATFAASNLLVDFNNLANPSTSLVSTGALTLSGNVALSLANVGLLSNGIIPLIHYTSKSGAGSFTQSSTSIGPRSLAVVSDTGSDIILTVASDKPKWTGTDSGNWVVGTTGGSSNWKLVTGGSATDYIEGDGVLFDDTATGTRTINISAANVLPVSTIFDTTATDYKLTSSGGFGIAGIGPLFKESSGTVVLTTVNTYTGPTTINDGILQLGDGTTDGSIAATSAIVINSGTLAYNNLTAKSTVVAISGSGGITKTGPGGLTLSGTNSYNGTTVLNAGTLTLGSTTALGGFGDLIINGGSLDSSVANLSLSTNHQQFWNADILFAGTNSLNLGSGFVTLGGSRQINVAANTLTVGGSIDGIGFSLTKLGAGTLVLNGSNSYDGGTTITTGTLRIGNANALGASGTIVFGGGTLYYGTGINVDLSDRIAASTTSSPINIDTNVQAVTFATALNSNQSGGLTVFGHSSGPAALVLTAANSYVGQTSITTDALLRVGANEVIPNGSVVAFSGVALGDHNAKFELQNFTETVAGITGTSGIVQSRESAGTGTGTLIIDTAGQNYTFEGLIRNQSGVLALVKNGLGTQTVTNTTINQGNNFTGGLTINGGTMKLREAGNGRVIGGMGSNVTIASGATLALEDTLLANTATTVRVISGAGNLEVSSGNVGIINLTGVNTYSGNTTVNGGTLIIATNSATTFADTSTISIAAGAILNLPNAVTDTIASLIVNGTVLPAGLYDSSTPATSAFLTGNGKLMVGATYSSWASTHVSGDAANLDTDNDGVKNGVEYFMNSPAGFTANPSVIGGSVTWPNGGNIPSSAYGTQFKVQTSPDLSIWTDILSGNANLNNTSGSVIYTLPTGAGTLFVRLFVTPN